MTFRYVQVARLVRKVRCRQVMGCARAVGDKVMAAACTVGAALGLSSAISTPVHAALDAAITGAVTDVDGLWDTIQPVVLGVVIFGIAVSFLKKLRRG